MTYDEIIKKAEKKPLTVKQHEKFFKPYTKEDDSVLFDFADEATLVAELFAKTNKTQVYQHIWTIVDGESGNLCTINGWHVCNRIGYMVCKVPWGTGNREVDNDTYIEAEY